MKLDSTIQNSQLDSAVLLCLERLQVSVSWEYVPYSDSLQLIMLPALPVLLCPCWSMRVWLACCPAKTAGVGDQGFCGILTVGHQVIVKGDSTRSKQSCHDAATILELGNLVTLEQQKCRTDKK
eukprot:GHUV01042578.1.p1 GENE.GHUV01042578.1~~GHUV01042578.1.p1  ORF type:complete len:124 (+),score=7.42 GHUV01042578.1:237-608(+)